MSYRLTKLSVHLADNDIPKKALAAFLGCSQSQVSYWIRQQMYVMVDQSGNCTMVKKGYEFNTYNLKTKS
jgi:uncharacterized protein YjcR